MHTHILAAAVVHYGHCIKCVWIANNATIHSRLEPSSRYLAITSMEHGVDLLVSQCEQIPSFP